MPKSQEISMRLTKTLLAGSLLTLVSSMALAQEARTGTVTVLNRISGTITIQPTPKGTESATVGATGGTAEQFKAQAGMLTALHAGDRVTFSVSETGGTKTITKIEKR
ncbi:MAG: copper-binding protein [Pseudomonadota bacterium]